MPSCTPGGSTTQHYGFCLPADGETNWGNAYRSTMTAIDQEIFNVGIPRSYLAGMQTTPTVASTSVSIAVGVAMGNDQSTAIRLTSALVKVLSSSWSVGSGNGGLYAATSIQGNQTYHLFTILRTDTSVVDAFYDTSPTAVNIPSPYTIYRRIASLRTATSTNMVNYVQDGDYFRLTTAIRDSNTANPGTVSVTTTLTSVPSGVNFQALINVNVETVGGGVGPAVYFSDLAADDTFLFSLDAGTAPAAQIFLNANTRNFVGLTVRTNTSSQIRYIFTASDANTDIRFITLGWFDTRGRDA